MEKKHLNYCGDLVRTYDPDRFLVSMFVSHKVRNDIWALLAFNHEIAKTREVVSDSALGHIRLQWWRDAIKGMYEDGRVLDHEVVKPLVEAVKRHDLPRERLEKLIYAREFDLENVAPASMQGLLNYADFTSTPLLQLITCVEGSEQSEEELKDTAMAYTVIGVLRAMPHLARQGRWMLPQDLSKLHGLGLDRFFDDENKGARCQVVSDIILSLNIKTQTNSSFVKALSALTRIYAAQIKYAGYDVCSPALRQEPAFKVLRVFWKTKCLCL